MQFVSFALGPRASRAQYELFRQSGHRVCLHLALQTNKPGNGATGSTTSPGVLPQLPGLPTEENIRQCNTRTAARCTAGARRTGSRQRRSLCARRALPVSVFLRLPVLPLRSAAPSAGPAFRYGQRRRRRGTRRQRWGARFLRLDRALCAPEHRAILAAEPDELVLAFYRLEALFALAPAQLVLAERLPPGPRVLALLALAPLAVVLADAPAPFACALFARALDAVVLANGSAAALYARPPLALVVTDARAPCGVQPDR